MGKRDLRQAAIRKIIGSKAIRTQQELADELKLLGFESTQTTISRDISDMGLVKLKGGHYVFPGEMKLKRMVREVVISCRTAGNMIVVRTQGGAASNLAALFDAAQMPSVLGSVAGDDTVFMVAETPEAARGVEKAILSSME